MNYGLFYLGTGLFHGCLGHEDLVVVVVDGGEIVVLVSVVNNLEGLHMLLEALDLGHDRRGIDLLVFVEVLEDKARTVADVLLDVLDLLDQEELVFLGQVFQVEFV